LSRPYTDVNELDLKVHLCTSALSKHFSDLLAKVNLKMSRSNKTPMATSLKLVSNSTHEAPNPSYTGQWLLLFILQYATVTGPNTAFMVNKLCQFVHRPLESHWNATKRVLRYQNNTIDHPKKIDHLDITRYYYSDMRFISGVYILLGCNMLSLDPTQKLNSIVLRL
ncbi:putative mitochondrial protein, partial [Mucuna pruriens]